MSPLTQQVVEKYRTTTTQTDWVARETYKFEDAKYYRKSLSTYYGKESVMSSNLYQLFSYL